MSSTDRRRDGGKSVLYFHGFASSPRSQKVLAFTESMAADGILLNAPDLNVPSFAALDWETIVALGITEGTKAPPAAIVGSSLGALIALDVARRGAFDAPLILIAPAIGISDLWTSRLPAGDPISVYNYAAGRELPIHRRFFEQVGAVDADRTPPSSRVVIFLGENDESIPPSRVLQRWDEWTGSGRLVTGSRLELIAGGDHGLVGSVGRIAGAIREAVQGALGSTTPLRQPL